jgi:Xaa-Pro dipeptidase
MSHQRPTATTGLDESDSREFAERLSKVRRMMRAEGFDGLLIADDGGAAPQVSGVAPPGHVRYLSNFAVPGALGQKYVALIVPADRQAILVVPPGVANRIPEIARSTSVIEQVRMAPAGGLADGVIAALQEAGLDRARIGLCGFFPGNERVFQVLEGATFSPANEAGRVGWGSDIVERLRDRKTDWEVARFRRAQELANAAAGAMHEAALVGTPMYRVTAEGKYAAFLGGAEEVHILCPLGPIASPYGRTWGPDRVLEFGDLVAYEIVTRVNGYAYELARSFTVGEPNKIQRHVLDTAQLSYEAMRDDVRVGVTGAELHDVGLRVIEGAGLKSWVPRSGHGIGLSVIEGSIDLLAGNTSRVVNGQCIMLHAGTLDPDSLQCAMIGDQVLVQDGNAVLMSDPFPYA